MGEWPAGCFVCPCARTNFDQLSFEEWCNVVRGHRLPRVLPHSREIHSGRSKCHFWDLLILSSKLTPKCVFFVYIYTKTHISVVFLVQKNVFGDSIKKTNHQPRRLMPPIDRSINGAHRSHFLFLRTTHLGFKSRFWFFEIRKNFQNFHFGNK